jgi:2-methylcitrate dehydratase PrpD
MSAAVGNPTLSERLAGYICEERFERIDPAAVARTKGLIAYNVGLGLRIARSRTADADMALGVARRLGGGGGSSSLIGLPEKLTMADAALANCCLIRATGLDDVIFPAGIHSGLMTIPTGLAIAEQEHCSGREFIVAMVSAYEMMGKFGRWTLDGNDPRRPTMPFGPFGALTMAGRLLRLPHRKMVVALAYAAHTAMGLAEHDLGPVSAYYGLVCRNAIVGAYFAQAGAWGSPTVLEGRFGFIEAFLSGRPFDPEAVLSSLGRDYVILQACEKRYPGTGANHVAIELLRQLRLAGLRAEDVAAIEVEMPAERQNFAAGHHLGPFITPGSASSSSAFHMGIILLDGDVDFARYDKANSPEILSLLQRFRYRFVEGKPIRYCRITVRKTSGETLVTEGDDFKFEPLPIPEILERDGSGVLPQDKIAQASDLIEHLEDVTDMAQVSEALRP